jgi:integrase
MLTDKINAYVESHRAMGFKYRVQNSLLQNFARFAEQQGDRIVRCQTVLEWARLAPSPAQKRNRLLTVRRFAIAMHVEDKRHEVPPADVFGHASAKRKIRHLFSDEDIKRLLNAASRLKPVNTIRPKSYMTLFALLATTGLRISEALALNIDDVTQDGLLVQSTKFRKDRLVPLHESTQQALQQYLVYRVRYKQSESAFFVTHLGCRLTYSRVNAVFLRLLRAMGLRDEPGTPGPCLHDLRHSFAVKSLEQCIGNPTDISRHMTALSTYLGHAHISDTYWYLQATPALLTQISLVQEACYREDRHD